MDRKKTKQAKNTKQIFEQQEEYYQKPKRVQKSE